MSTRQPPHETNGTGTSEPALAAYQQVWRVICHRKGRILLLVALGLAVAAAFCVATGPWYDASAQLLVLKKRIETTPITSPNQARAQEDYLSTHMLLITSQRVIGQAIEKGELQNLAQFDDRQGLSRKVSAVIAQALGSGDRQGPRDERIATEIHDALVVSRDPPRPGLSPSSEILNLSFRGRVAEDCPKVLEAIIASYQEFLTETYRNTNEETLKLINDARTMVERDLATKEAAYQNFLAATPPVWRGPDRSTPHQDRLFKLDARLLAVRTRRADLEASIAMLDRAIKEGQNVAAIVERMVGNTAPANSDGNAVSLGEPNRDRRAGNSLEQELLNLQLQKTKLLAVRAANHPDVLALTQQIENVRQMLLPPCAGQVKTANGATDIGTIKLALLKQELNDLALSEQSLTKLYENEQRGAGASYTHEIQDDAHRKGIERDRLLHESILNRLKEISSVKDFGGYHTEVIGPALQGRLAVKKYVLIFGLALFAGLLCGLGWAWLAELSPRRRDVCWIANPAGNAGAFGRLAANGVSLSTNGNGHKAE
jgi:uncharacterized protein involved in exopolysaccharide biosynthesis